MNIRIHFVLVFFLISYFVSNENLNATHNRAGEISVEQIDELTLRATIITYTKASSVDADRDSLTIRWGDGTSDVIGRINGNGQGELIGNDIKKNIYVGEHTYPGRSTYTISMMDPNRIAGIRNVNFPNSVIVQFYIATRYSFLNPQFQGFNNSVILLNPPLDFACVGKRFIHNPNAFDPDGDSLSYELIVPLQNEGETVPRYEFPDQVVSGPDNNISLDPVTGDFVWDAPQLAGEYNIAIRINEFRNGNLINYTIRDMQINVRNDCETDPPTIEAEDQLCAIAGDTINELIIGHADDPDQNKIRLSASGGPFELDISPSQFQVLPNYQESPLQGQFIWETACNHISDQFYTVVFKVEDDAFSSSGLVNLHQLAIKISGPPPQNLTTEGKLNEIELRWDKPYSCEETFNNYFNGFTIWRKEGVSDLEIDSCGTSPEEAGFVPIGFAVNTYDDDDYFYIDQTVEKGKVYCYRITAEFALRTAVGNHAFSRVQSLPSNESCNQLGRDVPLIVEVSVGNTDIENGEIDIKWTKPVVGDLDTLEFPGPYRYLLLRSEGIGTSDFEAVPGADFSSPTFASANDTSFTDTGINTEDLAYTYAVAFFTGGSEVEHGRSVPASSLRLILNSSRASIEVSWEENVPWMNLFYDVFLVDDSNQIVDSLARVEMPSFDHNDLIEGQEYCYLVRSHGTYGLDDIESPLLNYSQIDCISPIDTIPPCPPILEVSNICSDIETIEDLEDVELNNNLSWEVEECDFFDTDIERFQIFFAPNDGDDLVLIGEVSGSTFDYVHNPEMGVTGCYGITAVDSAGNVSQLSNLVCKSNCPVYELPNAFTPNNDGHNDLFTPFFPYLFIEQVEFEVFNRWGQKVFETNDPEINWDGTNFDGKELAEGVYHYRAEVYFRTVEDELSAIILNGFIELIR